MKKIISTLLVCGSALTASCANMGMMADQLSVSESATINASSADLWKLVGEFNDLERWHPAVTISKQVSDQRYLTLAGDGGEIVEQETARNDSEMTYSYRIVSSPLPVEGYEATISVTEVSTTKSRITWSSTFEADGVPDSKAEDIIRGVYQAGMTELQLMYR